MLIVSGLYHSTDCVINSISMNAFKSNVRYNTLVMQENSFKAYNVNSLCHFTAINLINSAKSPSSLIASHHSTNCTCLIQMT